MILADSINTFRFKHRKSPQHVLVSKAAAVILAAQETLPAQWDGVPVKLETQADTPIWMAHRVSHMQGTLIVLSVREDKLGRPCVVATEAITMQAAIQLGILEKPLRSSEQQ